MKIIQTRELEGLVRQTFPQKGLFSTRAELDRCMLWPVVISYMVVQIRTWTSISTRGSAARRRSFRPIK
jgi:hypothetical protein